MTLSGAAAYEWHRLADNRWYVDFQNTTLNGPRRDEHPSFGAVQSVRVRQAGSTDTPTVRVAFTLSGQQRIDLAPSESGLVITVSKRSGDRPRAHRHRPHRRRGGRRERGEPRAVVAG